MKTVVTSIVLMTIIITTITTTITTIIFTTTLLCCFAPAFRVALKLLNFTSPRTFAMRSVTTSHSTCGRRFPRNVERLERRAPPAVSGTARCSVRSCQRSPAPKCSSVVLHSAEKLLRSPSACFDMSILPPLLCNCKQPLQVSENNHKPALVMCKAWAVPHTSIRASAHSLPPC